MAANREAATRLLSSRGTKVTPENMARALQALESNPELLQALMGSASSKPVDIPELGNSWKEGNPRYDAFWGSVDPSFATQAEQGRNGDVAPTASSAVPTKGAMPNKTTTPPVQVVTPPNGPKVSSVPTTTTTAPDEGMSGLDAIVGALLAKGGISLARRLGFGGQASQAADPDVAMEGREGPVTEPAEGETTRALPPSAEQPKLSAGEQAAMETVDREGMIPSETRSSLPSPTDVTPSVEKRFQQLMQEAMTNPAAATQLQDYLRQLPPETQRKLAAVLRRL